MPGVILGAETAVGDEATSCERNGLAMHIERRTALTRPVIAQRNGPGDAVRRKRTIGDFHLRHVIRIHGTIARPIWRPLTRAGVDRGVAGENAIRAKEFRRIGALVIPIADCPAARRLLLVKAIADEPAGEELHPPSALILTNALLDGLKRGIGEFYSLDDARADAEGKRRDHIQRMLTVDDGDRIG